MVRTIASIGLLVGIVATAGAQVVTINFDTAPGGGAVANGTVVNSLYASQGVIFSRTATGASCNDGNIYASNDRPADFTISSTPNVVSTCAPPVASDISEPNFGAVRADFSSAVSQVCINVRPDGGTDTAFLRAYDSGASLLTTATSAAGVIQTLCATAPGIRHVEFSGAGASFERFDDLAVTFSSVASTPVPALAPIAVLALLALMTLFFAFGLRWIRVR